MCYLHGSGRKKGGKRPEVHDGVEAAKHRRISAQQQVDALLTFQFHPRVVEGEAGMGLRRALNSNLKKQQPLIR